MLIPDPILREEMQVLVFFLMASFRSCKKENLELGQKFKNAYFT
jgi:hypothetical protein